MTDFIFLGSKITADGDCSHEIRKCLLLGIKAVTNLDSILKAAREKQQITHKGIPIRITSDLSIETLQARREWQDILKGMKENNLQTRLLRKVRLPGPTQEEA